MANNAPPITPPRAAHNGGAGNDSVAYGQCDRVCNTSASKRTAHAARSHNGGASTPSIAKGVTTNVTHGIASALASKPTRETCWNSNKVSGVSASVMVHCSRKCRARLAPRRAARVAAVPLWGSSAPVANSTPTATKLSQKPACIKAHGSTAITTAQALNQCAGHGQRRPVRRSKATVASIHTVRWEGTPQPLNSAYRPASSTPPSNAARGAG